MPPEIGQLNPRDRMALRIDDRRGEVGCGIPNLREQARIDAALHDLVKPLTVSTEPRCSDDSAREQERGNNRETSRVLLERIELLVDNGNLRRDDGRHALPGV